MYYAACKTTEATFFFRNMTQSTFKLWLIGQFPDHLNHFIYEVRSMLLDRWSCLDANEEGEGKKLLPVAMIHKNQMMDPSVSYERR
jgi:hypothetical protein